MAQPRGQKPKPAHLHVVKGTDRPDRQVLEEAKPEGELGSAPEYLGELGRWFWEWARENLEAMGLGTDADRLDLEGMAVLYSRARKAEAVIEKDGAFFVDDGKPKRHPAAIEASQCRKELRLGMEAIGLSFTGRARNPPPAPTPPGGGGERVPSPYARPSPARAESG